ncbi:MAG: SDR family NAD(P)-dependent oxidoreductase [Ignavibacteria bacterium]
MEKFALVTGGARRLGRQISYYLADEGYNLGIIYNSSPKSELVRTSNYFKSKRIKLKFYKCDIKDLDQLKRTINRIGKDFGKIDLLVNNAGIIEKIDFEKITRKIYDDILNTNLRAALFTAQYCLAYLMKSKKPQIINIASVGGIQNWVKYFPYGISKAGVIKLTYLLAKRLAPKIRVNAIAPGTIIIEGEESKFVNHISADKIPLKRYGNPKDIIEAVKFLISCDYLTGQIIPVDGGRTLN